MRNDPRFGCAAPIAPPRIRRAGFADAPALALLIAEAFHPLTVSQWLIPDPDQRRRVFPAYFQIFVDHALLHGQVDTNTELDTLATWLPATSPLAPLTGYETRLEMVVGPYLPRFQLLDQLLERHQPDEPHHHLAFLATRPARQRVGLGSALLTNHHRHLDQYRIPGYLEASSPRSRDLYQRHGYQPIGDPFRLPDGPPLWPMWRRPAVAN